MWKFKKSTQRLAREKGHQESLIFRSESIIRSRRDAIDEVKQPLGRRPTRNMSSATHRFSNTEQKENEKKKELWTYGVGTARSDYRSSLSGWWYANRVWHIGPWYIFRVDKAHFSLYGTLTWLPAGDDDNLLSNTQICLIKYYMCAVWRARKTKSEVKIYVRPVRNQDEWKIFLESYLYN